MQYRPPVIILGGSDRTRSHLPGPGRDKHPLTGYKGADILFQGIPLVARIVERLEQSGQFGALYIAGPSAAYSHIETAATLIETDGGFAENIRVSLERVRGDHPGKPIAFLTCDVLPEVETLQSVMQHYRRHAPCDVWFPTIAAPTDPDRLGASGWKPSYRIAPQPGEPPQRVLPCHLLIADPDSLRLDLVLNIFHLAYRTRNRSVTYRRTVMLRALLAGLLWQDVLHVFGLRWPTLTLSVVWNGTRMGMELARGTITRPAMEDYVRRVLIKRSHQNRHPERRIVSPRLEGLSLALDIDTEEEAAQMGGQVANR